MAWIYRYQISKKEWRKDIDLREYSRISEVLQEYFGDNLKSIRVEREFIEYKLFNSVDSQTLRVMGKKLKPLFAGKEQLQSANHIFARRDMEYYLFIDPEYHMELVDIEDYSRVQNDLEIFAAGNVTSDESNIWNMARRYTEQYFVKHAEAMEGGLDATPLNRDYMQNRQIQLSLYMDSYEAFYDEEVLKEVLPYELSEVRFVCIRIKGRMIRESDNTEWELRGRDKLAMFSIPELDMMLNDGVRLRQNEIERNYLKISSAHREEKIQNIRHIFRTFCLKMKKCANEIQRISKGAHYKLTIHNVGQGQAVSVRADRENIPFLYFDYGCAYGKNLFTRAGVPIDLPTDKNTRIVISHRDMDHWYAYSLNPLALTCHWIMPRQSSVRFNNLVAKINVSGGKVENIGLTPEVVVNKNIKIFNFDISNTSIICSANSHKNGMSMLVCGKDAFKKDLRILIAGDQEYCYMQDACKQNGHLNILVATHHGGTYTHSTRSGCHTEIPDPLRGNDNRLIISCGKGNTYHHPSKLSDYKNWNSPSTADYTENGNIVIDYWG
ncbi:MAG: hypothetical protein HDR05_15310 [Lachnospiraceae bacterium]|nr:hypothetical protein [Lachnospiraceae bacterium]